MSGGARYPGIDSGASLIDFETELIKLQLQAENSFYGIAKSTGRPSVIFYDRGVLDVHAYLPKDKWDAILKRNDWTGEMFATRYDMILHLVTAADGAEVGFVL